MKLGIFFGDDYVGALKLAHFSSGRSDKLVMCMGDFDDFAFAHKPVATFELPLARRTMLIDYVDLVKMSEVDLQAIFHAKHVGSIGLAVDRDMMTNAYRLTWTVGAIPESETALYERLFDHDDFLPEEDCDLATPSDVLHAIQGGFKSRPDRYDRGFAFIDWSRTTATVGADPSRETKGHDLHSVIIDEAADFTPELWEDFSAMTTPEKPKRLTDVIRAKLLNEVWNNRR